MSRAHQPPFSTNGRDPVGHQGRQAAWRTPEHDPGVERCRSAALLPDQPARRPALPARRPPAIPRRCRNRSHRRRRIRRAGHMGWSSDRRPERRAALREQRAGDSRGRARRSSRRGAPPSTCPWPRPSSDHHRLRRPGRGARDGRPEPSATRTATTSSPSGRRAAIDSCREPSQCGRRGALPARGRPTRYGILGRTLALAADRPQASRAPQPAILLDEPDGTPPSCPTAGRSWPSPSREDGSRGGIAHRRRDARLARRPRHGRRARRRRSGRALLIGAHRADEVAHLLHRAEALSRVASDIGSRLDLDRILSGLVDHAMVLFEGDRGAVLLLKPDGRADAESAVACRPSTSTGSARSSSEPVERRHRGAPAAVRRPLPR
jgi:hypothetical protein